MLGTIARAGKFLLGIATAGIGIVAVIAGGGTAITALAGESEDDGETSSDE